MAGRDLVEAECGGPNPLVKVASHFTRDHALQQEGLKQIIPDGVFADKPVSETGTNELVKEFLFESQGGLHHSSAPQSFSMDTLLQEMRDIEKMCHPPLRAPDVADLATSQNWADEYLANEQETWVEASSVIWGQGGKCSSFLDLPIRSSPDLISEPKWAEEYLSNSQADPVVAPAAESETISNIWDDGIKAQEDKDLAQVANELLGTIEDPKFLDSEFLKFIKRIGDGETGSEINPMVKISDAAMQADIWSREYVPSTDGTESEISQRWNEDVINEQLEAALAAAASTAAAQQADLETVAEAAINQLPEEPKGNEGTSKNEEDQDFWTKLQEEWEQMAKEQPEEHPWLSEFDSFSDPYKEYKFAEENALQDHPEPFQEGMRRREEGDLPSAVLLFEAAVQRDPNHILV